MKMRARTRALDKIYKRRDRYEIPDWQREEVWNTVKKQKLVDTILRGWKLPKFYFLKTSDTPEEYEVLDGQQRLAAIWEFLDGDLRLADETASEFGGALYEELPDEVSDAFDDYELEFDEITDADEEEQKEFFQRLQEGLPLTSSEKLNAVHSKLRDYCMKLAEHQFFSETTVVANKRYAYFDIAAKVLTLEIEGLDAGTRFEDVKAVFKSNSQFSGNSAVAKRVKSALELHTELDSSNKQLRNRTFVQSVITFTCHLLNAGLTKPQYKRLAKFIGQFIQELSRQVELGQQATDPDYVLFQRTVNANVRSGARTRNDILLRKLFQSQPDFFSEFSQSSSLSIGLSNDIERAAKGIRRLIAQVNERYAAKHGSDLFKPTNKSIKALTTGLDASIGDFEGYKSLVENLYFIFRESVGQRLGENLPASFRDVNDLRTLNEHDVDHGKASKVAKRRKDLSDVFKKYSGAPTPDSFEPSRFAVVQSNLFAALEMDLRGLAKEYSA